MESLTARFHEEVFEPYLELLKSGYRFHPVFSHAKRIWNEKLTASELVNGPYLEKAQIYKMGDSLDSLALDDKTIATVRTKLSGRELYKHQTDALNLILKGKNAVITTGTSSGKTLCFQIPILDDLIRDSLPGLRAVIIYPLNALVNDQLEDWERLLSNHPDITFARFTGQTPDSQKDYESRLKDAIRQQLAEQSLTQSELQRKVDSELKLSSEKDIPNRLNHRDAIRANPPHILITNFSMLEYLLERPIDAPIFENARLKFLVLDEAHAYRGVQATEIAFLVRRLKDRLGLEKLNCIATSATLGKEGNEESHKKVRKFASDLFGEDFSEPNPIYGEPAEPQLEQPSSRPTPSQYIKAAEFLSRDPQADIRQHLGINIPSKDIASLLSHDENLYRLRKEILTKPTLLGEAAKQLWKDDPQAEIGLQALLEIAVAAMANESHGDLLPTRLHYFIRTEDGLHICLHKNCAGRRDGKPAFFVSRKNNPDVYEGQCPDCDTAGLDSKLVEIVTCRKCGYLFGALQDLGPRRAQHPENDELKPHFDSFSTELGWAADSFWSYFSVEDELPYPSQPKADEDEEDQYLFLKPAELEWCVVCGKKHDQGAGDNCDCEKRHTRKIKIFHRQCPAKKYENLFSQEKRLLTSCPNCGARNASGLEPVRRFQESDDETGLAMAIPLSHFQVTPHKGDGKPPRKLLCFTDHRQRAAVFPSHLEEETFAHDMGREIVNIIEAEREPLDLVSLGERLADIADPQSDSHNPDFFLPVSRFPDEVPDAKRKPNLWIAETLSYFGIPDSARESAEDLGLVAVEYSLKDTEKSTFHSLIPQLTLQESNAALQVLLGFMRQKKAFTLPKGVSHDDPAFGRVVADISYILGDNDTGPPKTHRWLPKEYKNGNYSQNPIFDYLQRLISLSPPETLNLANKIWRFLTSQFLLIENRGTWKLDHERIMIVKPESRYICNRCGIVTAYSARQCCPRKECEGKLEASPFNSAQENIIARWVADKCNPKFTTLKSEEHTAQINRDLAKRIEDDFRAEGVNLLSSTTTFEMGINIGDLQKVLLRNAPPTSASYVQRVGRAGRGKDKNSVCVTLCRRTKYDADAWNDPPRLMSGEVRTPTVFTQNKFIAQRHFNAVVCAEFLRIKVRDERVLGGVEQKIRLEAFLPLDSRKNIPDSWFHMTPTNLFLDFVEWLEEQNEPDIFQTEAGRSLLLPVSSFDFGKKSTKETYQKVIEEIDEELSALVNEMDKLAKLRLYSQASDIEVAVKNLLSSDVIAVLAKRGFLPRYAFPLDIVKLETEPNRWSRESEVDLSRDRGIAIAEFAPGAQVIARKKVFTSAGLYVSSKADKPERQWYSRCNGCEQIRTSPTQDPLKRDCSGCQKPITDQWIHPFVEPSAFSVRIDKGKKGSARHRRSTLIRQRQSIAHFIDSIEEDKFKDYGLFHVALKEEGTLFRYNLGPGNDGFILCSVCGASEPKRLYKSSKKHKRLRLYMGSMDCTNEQPWTKPLAYGHRFQSFTLIARPVNSSPSVESLAFALQRGLCLALDIDQSDIGVSWRWRGSKTNKPDAEIILYDRAPGGSGFVKEGSENWEKVVEEAKRVCEDCNCQDSCYNCLKSYENQSYHENLSRHKVFLI
ncbi:MAG: DEAD/DEAH box helicase [Deltaproteobacteria bacterium]